jgi:hypothetical protein
MIKAEYFLFGGKISSLLDMIIPVGLTFEVNKNLFCFAKGVVFIEIVEFVSFANFVTEMGLYHLSFLSAVGNTFIDKFGVVKSTFTTEKYLELLILQSIFSMPS